MGQGRRGRPLERHVPSTSDNRRLCAPRKPPEVGQKRTLLQTRTCDVLDGGAVVGSMAE
jgi:hypothetical protein